MNCSFPWLLDLVSEPGAGLAALEEHTGDAGGVLQLLNVSVRALLKSSVHHYKIKGQRSRWLHKNPRYAFDPEHL